MEKEGVALLLVLGVLEGDPEHTGTRQLGVHTGKQNGGGG